MTRTFARNVIAGIVAATVGTTAVATPAAAGGSFSVNVAPTSREQADAMRMGLGLYSLYNDVKNGASIRQNGSRNTAGLAQNGRRNTGIIHQEGNGHAGTINQTGNGNAYGLFQFGRNTTSNVNQSGNRQTGMTFQWGW